jgi:hypothetical protein
MNNFLEGVIFLKKIMIFLRKLKFLNQFEIWVTLKYEQNWNLNKIGNLTKYENLTKI